jgi:HlyD family secretion protein
MTRRRTATLALIGIVVLVGAALGYRYYLSQQRAVPPGIVFGNGRIEADEIGIATKYPGRIVEIRFEEGDLVTAGQVLARMDTQETEASERAAAALVAQRTKDRDAVLQTVKERQSQLDLANSELKRGVSLLARDAVSRQTVEQQTAAQQTAESALAGAQSQVAGADAAVDSARAEDERLQHMITDATLVAPKNGRVLYKLAETGETLPAGGQVATMLDLSDVYMTIFLPSEAAAKVPLQGEGRIVLDALPDRAIPGKVSFVSARAQFTPKQVETQAERERMMFRVKVQIPPSLVEQYIARIKTGVTGIAYVKTDDKVAWPAWLESNLTTGSQNK